jgi:hypothetical protein
MDVAERTPPRWFPLAAAAATCLVVVWLLVFTWSGITGSHPAYLITLVVTGLLSIGWAAWAVLSTPPTRSPRRTWISRTGLVVATALLIGLIIYPRPLPAEQRAIDALADGGTVDVTVSATEIRMDPTENRHPAGLVFYPGAKVDPRAYARILRPLAEDGFTVVILKLPYNIAFFGAGAAGDVVGDDDGIDGWVVAGHSLGGTVAANFAARQNRSEVAGLLLWASFPAKDISTISGLDVVSVSGSNDGLATPAKIDRSRRDLPASTRFVVIEGANHADFGDYGAQDGDGTATIPRDDAQAQIIAATLAQLQRVEHALPAR